MRLYFSFRKSQTNPIFMKKRISGILNFFAFNFLFFALYLNFVHKDSNIQSLPVSKSVVASTGRGTVLVSNPEQYLNKIHKEESQNNQSQN
jgi:hypothetical protein